LSEGACKGDFAESADRGGVEAVNGGGLHD
jgi:hypothetical protein